MDSATLTPAQLDGLACVSCGREDGAMVPAGVVDGVQVFAHATCPRPDLLPEEIARLEALLALLPGPWEVLTSDWWSRRCLFAVRVTCSSPGSALVPMRELAARAKAAGMLAAACLDAMPRLLVELRRARQERAELRQVSRAFVHSDSMDFETWEAAANVAEGYAGPEPTGVGTDETEGDGGGHGSNDV